MTTISKSTRPGALATGPTNLDLREMVPWMKKSVHQDCKGQWEEVGISTDL